MLNYIKCEWYRILHSKEIYLITGILSIGVLFMNIVTAISSRIIPDFKYGLVSFSLNTLTSSLPWLFCIGMIVTGSLYAEERKNGTLKNAIAYGIPRSHIFIGKIVMSMIFCLLSMAVVLVFLVGSAVLLLEGPVQEPVRQMFCGIASALPSAFASVVLSVAALSIFRKEMAAYLVWAAVMYGIPVLSFFAGLQFKFFNKAAEWMPWNFFNYEVRANMAGYNCLWDTPDGLMKCIVAGVMGIVIFTAAGLLGVRKKDIQ